MPLEQPAEDRPEPIEEIEHRLEKLEQACEINHDFALRAIRVAVEHANKPCVRLHPSLN
jgi:hypothetical protein